MKHTSPQGMNNLSFDELVRRAKSGESGLSATDLDRMVARLEERLRLEGVAQSGAAGSATASGDAASGTAKWGPGTKALLGGAGLAAVAAFIYGTSVTAPNVPPVAPTDVVDAVSAQVDVAPKPHSVVAAMPTLPAIQGADQAANDTPPAIANRPRKSASSPRAGQTLAAPVAAPVEVSPTPEPEPATVSSSPLVTPKPAPALDASLALLERAERELRGGNPGAALSTLAEPVVPSLSSRAEALRAVALCQSGQTAKGVAMAQRHLASNPSSPYQKRLTSACGRDL